MAEGERVVLGPTACYICGGHNWASYFCAECERPICMKHTKEGNDGKPYCPEHIGPHTGGES